MLDVDVIFFFNQMVILYFYGHRCSMNENLWGVLFGIFFPELLCSLS